KAITLTQPWAQLVATGQKKVETRSWKTAYRGTLAIHSGKTVPAWAKQAIAERRDLNAAMFGMHGFPVPMGCIVAVVKLSGIIQVTGAQWEVDEQERPYGDYSIGRYAWILTDLRRLPTPIECKGAMGLWAVPASVEIEIVRQGLWSEVA